MNNSDTFLYRPDATLTIPLPSLNCFTSSNGIVTATCGPVDSSIVDVSIATTWLGAPPFWKFTSVLFKTKG